MSRFLNKLHNPGLDPGAEASRVDREAGPVNVPTWEAACGPPKRGTGKERLGDSHAHVTRVIICE